MNTFKIGVLSIPVTCVQVRMGIGISLAYLASAEANAGGIGIISTIGQGLIYNIPNKSYKENNREAIKNEIRKVRKLTKVILGLIIIAVLRNFEDLLETAIDGKIDIIFSGADLPFDQPKYLKPSSLTKLVLIVFSGRAANIIAIKWKDKYRYLPDAFVVEGLNAGGHFGSGKYLFCGANASKVNLFSTVPELF